MRKFSKRSLIRVAAAVTAAAMLTACGASGTAAGEAAGTEAAEALESTPAQAEEASGTAAAAQTAEETTDGASDEPAEDTSNESGTHTVVYDRSPALAKRQNAALRKGSSCPKAEGAVEHHFLHSAVPRIFLFLYRT